MTNIPASVTRLFKTDEPKELDIETVVDSYLAYRDLELGDYETADQTYDKIKDHLTRFIEWVEERADDDEDPLRLNDLNRSRLEQFKIWRKTDGPCEDISLVGQLSTLAVFLDFCEEFDVVDEGLSDQVPVPSVAEEEQISDEKLEKETAQLILEYLTTCEPGSRRHAEFVLLWEVGMRMGAARGIDLTDCHLDEGYIELRHRPDTDTPLKNKKGGERVINISPGACETLKTYIIHNRKDKQDEGREPLFTTKNGRISLPTLRKEMYRLTSPCVYTNDCPFDRDPLNCEFTSKDRASECEGSVSPHPIRRGAIVRQLNRGIPIDDRNLAYAILSDRVDVSKKVLEKHYDPRSEMEKGRKRRDELAQHIEKYGEQVDIQVEDGVGNTEALLKATSDKESVSADDGQSTLANFAGFEPISIALLYVSETLRRCLARLRRELTTLSPDDQIIIPSRERATRGAIAYVMFVVLLGIDFGLLGITVPI